MDILILHSWLKEHLKTNATAKEISNALTLCGPTVNKLERVGNDWLYDIEITTNRVDAMSVYGIAREASAILPEFGFKAKLIPLNPKKPATPKKSLPFSMKPDFKLVGRAMGVVLENIENWKSPDLIKSRLEASGVRSLNSVVDITNYVMLEVGHPSHAFDYDKIKNKLFVIRESDKGEKVTSFDGKTYSLPGGDIVFDDGEGEIIDLPGIIGTKNSVVDAKTKRIFFFIDNNNPSKIRKTSNSLGVRTNAAILNEKHVDPELASVALYRGIELFQKVCNAKVASKVYDIRADKAKPKVVSTNYQFIIERLGVSVSKAKIKLILNCLSFKAIWKGNSLTVVVPSFRSKDITIPEDIVEEVARIYGYHNIPGTIMQGKLPEPIESSPFEFEDRVKTILVGFGGIEVYTHPLVSESMVRKDAISLKNPLGDDTKYLRTSLVPSLIQAIKQNSGSSEAFWLFEMANVYLPVKGNLPEERMMLGSIFSDMNFRSAKGIVEALLESLNVKAEFVVKDELNFTPGRSVVIKSGSVEIGQLGVLEQGHKYFEFNVEKLRSVSSKIKTFTKVPKYPAQIEDITFKLPKKTKVQDVIKTMLEGDKRVSRVELVDTYKDSYTLRVWYLDETKTLNDREVKKIRKKIIKISRSKFGARQK